MYVILLNRIFKSGCNAKFYVYFATIKKLGKKVMLPKLISFTQFDYFSLIYDELLSLILIILSLKLLNSFCFMQLHVCTCELFDFI